MSVTGIACLEQMDLRADHPDGVRVLTLINPNERDFRGGRLGGA
jgi:hypothetical protein